MRKKLKLINQPYSHTGCGIAAFAMAGEFTSYVEAEKWMKRNKLVKNNGYVTVTQMKSAVEKRLKVNTSITHSKRNATDTAIYYVRFSKNDRTRHWIVKHNNIYYDPLSKKTKKFIKSDVTRIVNIHS